MEKILVLTDFSDIAQKGLEAAAHLAAQLGSADIYLLNTEEETSGRRLSVTGDITKQLDPEEDRYMIELIRANRQRLEKLTQNFQQEGVRIKAFMEIGSMQDIVDEFLEKHPIDLVVMGTSGESTFEEYFVGNHTEQVIRVADVPVLSVKVSDQLPAYNKIVLATDTDKGAARGIPPIKTLATKLGASLHLVHVTDKSPEKVKFEIEHYVRNNEITVDSVNVVNNQDTEEGIKNFAAKIGADMIAVITHGRSGLRSLVSHSVSQDVIKEASVPVLTVNMKELK